MRSNEDAKVGRTSRSDTANRRTWRSDLLFAALLCLAGCSANPGKDVARKAATAMTGSPETLTAVVSLTLEGNGTLGGEPVSWFNRAMTFRRGRWREELTREKSATQVSGVDGKVAYDGSQRSGEDRAQERRRQLYHHPVGFLLTVFAQSAPFGNTREEGGRPAMDLTVEGVTYTLLLDPKTNLPARIVSKMDGRVRETSFGEYRTVHGYTLPYRVTEKVDGQPASEWMIARQYPGPDIPNLVAP